MHQLLLLCKWYVFVLVRSSNTFFCAMRADMDNLPLPRESKVKPRAQGQGDEQAVQRARRLAEREMLLPVPSHVNTLAGPCHLLDMSADIRHHHYAIADDEDDFERLHQTHKAEVETMQQRPSYYDFRRQIQMYPLETSCENDPVSVTTAWPG